MRRLLLLLTLLFAMPLPLAAQSTYAPAFNPAADYITAGQDEPGYQSWYKAASWRPIYVRAFHNYLVTNGVSGVAPTWQLLRTATDWQRCGADPFEVPPTEDWANIVATLRFIRTYVVPRLGPVEPVSVYRNPLLNACAGGAQASTHREMGAVDIVPLRPITRDALMLQLCAIHAAHPESNNGLGFYKGLRFHIDARKYREWGTQSTRGSVGCNAVLAENGVPLPAPARPAAAPAPVLIPTTRTVTTTLPPAAAARPAGALVSEPAVPADPLGVQPANPAPLPLPPVPSSQPADRLAPLGQ